MNMDPGKKETTYRAILKLNAKPEVDNNEVRHGPRRGPLHRERPEGVLPGNRRVPPGDD